MAHINHGTWVKYQPTVAKEGIPLTVMYAHRESDGMDWYDYVNPPAPQNGFLPDSVIIAAIWREDIVGYVVGPAVYDPTAMFPAGHIVIEVNDYTGTNPQADLGGKVYDPETGMFSDPPQLVFEDTPSATEQKIMSVLDTILARLDKLEKK